MRPLIAFTVLVVAAFAAVPAEAAGRPIGDFFGTFVGRSISVIGEGLSQRDLNVVIKKHKKGEEINRCLKLLESQSLARCETENTAGRSAEIWFATG